MKNKITLVTPPDFFENEDYSILLIGVNDQDQETISQWLANSQIDRHINIYFYMGETNVDWLLYALARSDATFIDVDNLDPISAKLGGYILGKKHTFYKTKDDNLSALYSYINLNRIKDIEFFLQRIMSDKLNTILVKDS
jgi:hypothetical protein